MSCYSSYQRVHTKEMRQSGLWVCVCVESVLVPTSWYNLKGCFENQKMKFLSFTVLTHVFTEWYACLSSVKHEQDIFRSFFFIQLKSPNPMFFKTSFMSQRRKSLKQGWNGMRDNKWWQNIHFGGNVPFNTDTYKDYPLSYVSLVLCCIWKSRLQVTTPFKVVCKHKKHICALCESLTLFWSTI